MNAVNAWNKLCPPAQIYPVVMIAVVLFSLYRGAWREAATNVVSLLVGTLFLWILCAANFEFAAYGLLILPVLFFVFFLAIVLFDQSLINVTHKYKKCGHPQKVRCACHA